MPHPTSPCDVIIIGGGVMGCASALRLRQAGLSVTVFEEHVIGSGASSAAAGMLGAQLECHEDGPLARLALASRALFPSLASELRDLTGLDIGYRRSGVLRVLPTPEAADALERDLAWQRRIGERMDRLDARAIGDLEPAINPNTASALHFPADGRVDPPLLLRAIELAARQAGVRFALGQRVHALLRAGERVTGVQLADGTTHDAAHVVLAAGSWSSLIGGTPLATQAIVPARGQIVALRAAVQPLRCVVFGPGCYLSPRDDGRVLIGSTLERVGYQATTTARAVRDLLTAATALLPALEDAALDGAWSGFRPLGPRDLPWIGPTSWPGLTLATAHYRNGILLAPITAALVAAALTGAPPPLDPTPFHFSP